MQVLLEACTSSGAYIESHIETLGLRDFSQKMLGMDREIPDVEGLFGGEILHTPSPLVGNNHDVTRGVGVLVQDQKSILPTADHEMGRVIAGSSGFSKKILPSGPLPTEVFHAPRSPERLEMFFGE